MSSARTPGDDARRAGSGQIEQLLVETAVAADPVDQMDLEDPMAQATAGVLASHQFVRSGHDVPLDGISGDLLVRKLPDQVAGDAVAPLETLVASHPDDVVEQFGARNVGVTFKIVTPGPPHPRERIADRDLVRIVAQHERAPEVSLPLLENRAQVAEHDIVGGDHAIRRPFSERLQSVLT